MATMNWRNNSTTSRKEYAQGTYVKNQKASPHRTPRRRRHHWHLGRYRNPTVRFVSATAFCARVESDEKCRDKPKRNAKMKISIYRSWRTAGVIP
jgi:hypothetical protein